MNAAVWSSGDRSGDLRTSCNVNRITGFQTVKKLLLRIRRGMLKVLFANRVVSFSRTIRKASNVGRGVKASRVSACDYQPLFVGNETPQPMLFTLTQFSHVREYQRLTVEVRERPRSDNLKFKVLLHQQDQNSTIRRNEALSMKIPRFRREVDANGINWRPLQVERFFMRLDPGKDPLPCR